MTRWLAIMALVAWGLGAVATPLAGWIWLRAGRAPLALVVLGGLLVAEAAWLFEVATGGLEVIIDSNAHDSGWPEWMLGVGGTVALFPGLRGLAGRPAARSPALSDPDSAVQVAIGFLALGYLLRQLALLV